MFKLFNKFFKKYYIFKDLFVDKSLIFICNINNISEYKRIEKIKTKKILNKKFLKKNFLFNIFCGGFNYIFFSIKDFDKSLIKDINNNKLYINYILEGIYNYNVTKIKSLNFLNKNYFLFNYLFNVFLVLKYLNYINLLKIKKLSFLFLNKCL